MDGERLPRSARLLNAAQFRHVFGRRQAASDHLLRLHYAAAEAPRARPRLGLAISKRAVPKAVARNRVRRQVREIFRRRRLRLRPGDYVFTALPAARSAGKAELRIAAQRLLDRFEMT